MDIYLAMSMVAQVVRSLELREDGVAKAAVLRSWLLMEGLKKPDLDKLIAAGSLSKIDIEAAVTKKPRGKPVKQSKNRSRTTKVR